MGELNFTETISLKTTVVPRPSVKVKAAVPFTYTASMAKWIFPAFSMVIFIKSWPVELSHHTAMIDRRSWVRSSLRVVNDWKELLEDEKVVKL